MIRLALLLFLLIIAFMMMLRGIKVIRFGQVMILERLGAFNRKLTEGMHFIIPIIDEPREIPWQFLEKDKNGKYFCVVKNVETIPLSENVFYFLNKSILKKDYSKRELDVLVYFIVEDPEMAAYGVASLPKAFDEIISLALKDNTISNEIIQGDYSIAKNMLWENISEKAKKFGIKVNKVEIKNIK